MGRRRADVIYPSKCEVVRVTKRRNPVEAIYQIHGHDLTIAKTGKYLGAIISEDLSWKSHIPLKKPSQLPPGCKSPVLQDPGRTHPWVCRACMGPTHNNVHPAVGGGITRSSHVCQRWLLYNKKHLPDDTGPRPADTPTATRRCQTIDGVPNLVRSGGDPCFQILPPNNIQHQSALPAVQGNRKIVGDK